MKTIGLIGGMSWESSIEYYRIINQLVSERMGGYHSVKIIMISLDFSEIESHMKNDRWTKIQEILVSSARTLENCGADFFLICTNTMHKLAQAVQSSVDIPLLHIADAMGARVRSMGLDKVGLLGTRITMEDDFYRLRLEDAFGLRVLIPKEDQRQLVHHIIFDQLVKGKCLTSSRDLFLTIMAFLIQQGAQGIILGCTEIGLLVKRGDINIPLFDSTLIHATAAVDLALADQ